VRVAITGSHGLIGEALVASLESDGHTAVRIPRDLDVDLEGVEGVVNLAGESIGAKRWSPDQKHKVLTSRTDTTTRLAEKLAALKQRPRVLVSGSAIGIYGDRGEEPLTEASTPGGLFLSEICVAWEAATHPAHDAGIRVAHIRTGLVLARKGGALGKILPLFKLGLGGRMGSGRQWWSWIALDDEVGAIRFLLEHDEHGPVNLTAPNPVTNAEFTKTLAKVLHRPSFAAVPRFGPRVLLGTELSEELLFSSQRVTPAVLEMAGYEFKYPELESALRALLA